MANLTFSILALYKKNISTSLWVCSSTICNKFNVQIGGGRHLKGFDQASLSGARRGYMPPRLKTKQNIEKMVEVDSKFPDGAHHDH